MQQLKYSPKKPVYAFIDSQNLNLGVQSQGWELDFTRFRVFLKDKYQVKRVFLFIGFITKYESLYTFLKKSGYTVIYKPVLEQKRKSTPIKGNVDAELVLHTIIEFNNYDKAIIVSGDGDFHCLVEYLANKNKLFKLIVPNRKYSSLLRKFSRYIVNVDLFREKLKKKHKK
ncbi:MAG: NYN domain-containing protein [bacterium]|nr:NYN domain-containing protein [bacterium]